MPVATLAALVGLWLGPAASPPQLDAPDLALRWTAPGACPQRDELDAKLHALLPELGPLADPDQAAPLWVEGQISLAAADRWTAELRFVSELGVDERELSGPDCEALTDAVALVIAVGLDPVGVSTTLHAAPIQPEVAPSQAEPTPAPAGPEPEPTLSVQLEPVEALPAEDSPPRVPLRLALAALGGGGYGPLDLGVGRVGAALAVLGPHWRAEVRGTWLTPRRRTVAGAGEARFAGYAFAVRGCGVPVPGGVELPVCAGIEAGSLRGEGVGTTPNPREGSAPWIAAVVGPGLRWAPRPRVALALDLELLVPLVRGGFRIADVVVADIAPVGVQAFAGVELRLP